MAQVKIGKTKRSGKGSRLTKFSNGWTVETWWDASCRDWVSQTKDDDGCQPLEGDVGLTRRAGTAEWAFDNHTLQIEDAREHFLEVEIAESAKRMKAQAKKLTKLGAFQKRRKGKAEAEKLANKVDANSRLSFSQDKRQVDMPARIFIAIGKWAWGQGATIDEAIASYRKIGGSGRRKTDIKIFLLPENAKAASVDGLGSIRWTGPNNDVVEVS